MAIYNGKHCVFEQVGLENDSTQWNTSTNVDGDNAINDWNISYVRNTFLPAQLSALSSALQDNLTNTTIQTATNGINGTLVNTSDKLFLQAEKEMNSGIRTYSRTEEFSALTTWSYRTTHTQASDRKKYDSTSTTRAYRLRSPRNDTGNGVMYIYTNGNFSYNNASSSSRLSPCFAF